MDFEFEQFLKKKDEFKGKKKVYRINLKHKDKLCNYISSFKEVTEDQEKSL